MKITLGKSITIFSFSLLTLLILPFLFQKGMFVDGVTYASIAKNMSSGIGSFWNPVYTQTFNSNFIGHPPLMFGLLAIFFKIFGLGLWVEKLFSLSLAILSAFGIISCFRISVSPKKKKSFAGIAIILWLCSPIIFWSFRNNMLENLVSVSSVWAVFFVLYSIKKEKPILGLLSALLIFIGFLTKGPVALFPIVVPLIYLLIYRRNYKLGFFIFLNSVTGFFLLLILNIGFSSDAQAFMTEYFNIQVISSFKGTNEMTTSSRFSILWSLVQELVFPLSILIIILTLKIRRSKDFKIEVPKEAILYLLIGLSATLPIMLTLKQRGFYLVPAIASFSISISIIIVSVLEERSYFNLKSRKILLGLSILVFTIAIILSVVNINTYSRDQEMIRDVSKISSLIPEGSILRSTPEICSNWGLIAYLYRIGSLSVDCESPRLFLMIKNEQVNNFPQLIDEYSEITYEGNLFSVFAKK